MFNKLIKSTSKKIKFLGKVSDEVLDEYLSKAKGYIFPVKEEDFGIALVEALNHGTPSLAHRSGGPLEIIREGVDGLFFDEINIDSLTEKFIEFDKKINENYFDRKEISVNTKKFDEKIFSKEFSKFVENKWNDFYQKP